MNDENICKQCGKEITDNHWNYCSNECRRAYNREQYRLRNPFKGTSSATTGAISELRVAVDLMVKGYNVFRALSPSCPCDLVLLKDGHLLKIEVRTTYKTTDGKVNPAKSQRDKPQNIDIYALVLPDEIIYQPELPRLPLE